MVFNIIQNNTRSCYKCGKLLGMLEGGGFELICDDCKHRERQLKANIWTDGGHDNARGQD